MANFQDAFKKFKGIEFNRSDNVLHKNAGESGLTFYGIYQTAHKHWSGWSRIMAHLMTHNFDLRRSSISASHDEQLIHEVKTFYYLNYWLPLRLDEIHSQQISEELFFFYLNIGNKSKVVKYAQSIVGTKADGKLGKITIKALNEFDERIFDVEYDLKQISHYKRLVAKYPKRFARFLKGWINRAKMI